MSRDGYVTLGTLLTPEEAGMAQSLLETAGIEALLEDQALSAIDPLVRFAIGGTKLLVRAEDAERARELIAEVGVLSPASARPAEEIEIPESEWSAVPPEPPPAEPTGSLRSGARVLFVIAVFVAAAYALLDEARRPRWPPWGP